MAMNTVQKSEVERYKRDILKNEQDRMSWKKLEEVDLFLQIHLLIFNVP